MAFIKTSLISRPVQSDLGLDWSDIGGGVSKVVDFFGAGIKAQGAAEALQAQAAAQAQAQAARGGGVPTTYLLVGGLALAGVLVFAMTRK